MGATGRVPSSGTLSLDSAHLALGGTTGGQSINRIAGAVAASLLVALLGALVDARGTNALPTGRIWRAPVGNGWPTQNAGSNGLASIDLFWTGGGALTLELENLVRNTVYSVTLFKGPIIAPGSSWSSRGDTCRNLSDGPVVRLPAMRTSEAGTIAKSITLSVSQMARIRAIPRKIAITVGSGRLARCGGFQLMEQTGRSTDPPPSASPTVDPGPLLPPTCSVWPSEIADILAVLTTPDGLCLVRYPGAAEAPAYMRGFDGMYFPGLRTIVYVAGVEDRETAVLAHEVCHAHQDRVTRDEVGMELVEGWDRTAMGQDYLQATGWRRQGDRWVVQPESSPKRPDGISSSTDPLEDNAGTCALWFDPAFGPRFLRRWAPIRFAWAQRWLPLPSFIQPWTSIPD